MSKTLLIAAVVSAVWLGEARSQTFTYTTENSKTIITGVSGASGTLTVPATLGGYNVTEIGRSAFKDQTAITSITFAAPANVAKLGATAFQGCTALQSVALPTGITAVPPGLLQGCTALTSVTVQSGVTSIGAAAFADCRSLPSVTLPTSVTSLGESAFLNCRSLASLTIPSGVTVVPGQFAQECRSLTSLSLPAGVTQIGPNAFYNCAGLTSFSLPTGATSVARDAFQGCGGLTTLGINGALASLGDRALLGCGGLTAITVDVTNATYSSLNGVLFNKAQTMLLLCPAGFPGIYTVPSTVTSLAADAFAHCAALITANLPASVTSLPQDAFYYATGLTRLAIPASVTTIGDWAVAGCSRLASITIPASVSLLGNDAFHYDRALTYALFNGNAPTTSVTAFDGAGSNFTIYYYASQTGFSSPTWLGYPAAALSTPSALVTWLTQYGYSPGTAVLADPDGDGVSFLLAYALGLNPTLNLAGSLPVPVQSASTLSLTFQGNAQGITYTPQTSIDLQTWTTTGITVSAPDANGLRTASVPTGTSGSTQFLRLLVGY